MAMDHSASVAETQERASDRTALMEAAATAMVVSDFSTAFRLYVRAVDLAETPADCFLIAEHARQHDHIAAWAEAIHEGLRRGHADAHTVTEILDWAQKAQDYGASDWTSRLLEKAIDRAMSLADCQAIQHFAERCGMHWFDRKAVKLAGSLN